MSEEQERTELKEFSIEKKGYNRSEVDSYISSLEEDFNHLRTKISALEEDLNQTKVKLDEYQQIDAQIRDAFIHLTESERSAIERTREEVTEIMEDADTRSRAIIESAETEAKSTRDMLLFLKEQHEILLTRLKIIIDSQEGMLNDFVNGNEAAHLQKSMAEAATFKTQTELSIDSIVEKLI